MRSEVLKAVKIAMLVFWVVTPCGLVRIENWRTKGAYISCTENNQFNNQYSHKFVASFSNVTSFEGSKSIAKHGKSFSDGGEVLKHAFQNILNTSKIRIGPYMCNCSAVEIRWRTDNQNEWKHRWPNKNRFTFLYLFFGVSRRKHKLHYFELVWPS
jgi:hypothetical protein